jgi:hypothetical protein
MRVMCAFCFVHFDIGEDDRSTVCENCQVELLVYEDGTSEVLTDETID